MEANNNKFIRKCISESLLELMKTQDFNDISITEITTKAGVSRMAYYRNYTNKEDILNDYMTELIEDFKENRKQYEDSVYLRYLLTFNFFKEHKDFLISMEKSNLSIIILNKINEYMTVFYPDYADNIEDRYSIFILSGAIYNTCKMWIMNGLKETPEEIAQIFVNKMFK